MPYPAGAIANEFLNLAKESGKQITPMKLLKLVYFAHGWHLALTGKPLINEPVQAWKFGPVIPSLYHALKIYGNTPIAAPVSDNAHEFADPNAHACSIDDNPDARENAFVKELVKRVWDVYGGFSAVQLSNLTHEPGSPWYRTPDRDKRREVAIDENLIREYFRAQAERNKQHADA